jgi:hypothetical protein
MSEISFPENKTRPKKGLDVLAILAIVIAIGYLGVVGAGYFGLVGYKPREIADIYVPTPLPQGLRPDGPPRPGGRGKKGPGGDKRPGPKANKKLE